MKNINILLFCPLLFFCLGCKSEKAENNNSSEPKSVETETKSKEDKMVVSKGDSVKVQYEGRLESGEVFDKSSEDRPLEFIVGGGQIIPGFDKAVLGMENGEEKEVKIAPEEAYGEKKEELVIDVPKERLPENIEPAVGMVLQTQDTNTGRSQMVTITEIDEDNVKIDFNHPLAGKTLTFKIEVVEIN